MPPWAPLAAARAQVGEPHTRLGEPRTPPAELRTRVAARRTPRGAPRLFGARTLRSWAAARSRRRLTDPSSASRRQGLAARLEALAAVARPRELRAVVARRVAGPNPVALAVAHRTPRLEEAELRSRRAARRWHRTDSSLRASLAGSAADQRAQRRAAVAAGPTLREVRRREPELQAAADKHPTARAAAVAAAARTAALVPVVRPIVRHLEVADRVEPPLEPAAHNVAEDLADLVPAPPRRARLLPKARRKTGKTCWWAGWLRHTACRRS